MAEIKEIQGRPVINYMARDYESILQSMRSMIPSKLPEWKDFESEADFGNVLLQLFAHMGDILSYYQDRIANEAFLGTAQSRKSIIHHLRLIGYQLSTASPASAKLKLTITVPDTNNDIVTINRGDAFATKSQKDKPSVRFEYTREQPFVINFSTIEPDPVTNKKHYEGFISVEQGRLIKEEVLGVSDGTANQEFTLAHPRLILRAPGQAGEINKDIVVISQIDEAYEEWTLQESLAFSRELQKDFIIEIDEEDRASIIFGDNVFGAIPEKGAVIKATYRVGGGSHGNVLAHAIRTIVDAPQLALLGVEITNLEPATGGAERESIDHAVLQAPSVFRSLKRAVTAEDYEALALDFTGVGKVRAVPANWNVVKLYVAPQGGGHVSDILRANLLAYFEDKRLITTIIDIEDVDYVKIYVTAEIGVKGFYDKDEVKEQVKKEAGKLLAFNNVDFGQFIFLSKFYEAIEAIKGVEFVNITEFRRQLSNIAIEPTGKIELRASEIPTVPDAPEYAGGIRVVLEGEL